MKHAIQLASLSVAALFAASAHAGKVTTFNIDFDDYTTDAPPSGSVDGGTWTPGSGDSYVEVKNGTDKQLVIDAPTNSPLAFAPATNLSQVVSLDVQFVAATTAPLTDKTGTKVALYLLKDATTTNLQVSVNGGAFAPLTGVNLEENHWYRLTIAFTNSQTRVSVAQTDGTPVATYTGAAQSSAAGVSGVDFFGTGLVDNFAGSYPFNTAIDDDADPSSDTDTDTEMEISGTTLTTQFAASNTSGALKFITVTDAAGKSRTLRIPDGSASDTQSFNLSQLGNITKVVAYYGNDVTATAGAVDDASTPVFSAGTATGNVTAKSGVYYALSVNNTLEPLQDEGGNNVTGPIPETVADDYTLYYTVSPTNTAYGVKKFKIVASDTDPF